MQMMCIVRIFRSPTSMRGAPFRPSLLLERGSAFTGRNSSSRIYFKIHLHRVNALAAAMSRDFGLGPSAGFPPSPPHPPLTRQLNILE